MHLLLQDQAIGVAFNLAERGKLNGFSVLACGEGLVLGMLTLAPGSENAKLNATPRAPLG